VDQSRNLKANSVEGHDMRQPWSRRATIAIVLTTAGLLALIWWFRPRVYDTVRQADRLTLYEGLPHPNYEKKAFQEELKSKQTMQLCGFMFYLEPLDLKDEDVKTLRGLLGNRSTYKPHQSGKECGGFHPDYAVEWSTEGKVYRCLICFGCSEARFDGPQGESDFYNLRSEGQGRERRMKLLGFLRAYQKNRPSHERFGVGPLAVTSRL